MPAHPLSIALFALPALAFLLGLGGLPARVGLLFAIASLIAWLGGRAISLWIRWVSQKPPAGPKKQLG